MGETSDRQMTVREARRLLQDTSRQPPERVRAAEELLRARQLEKPGYSQGGGLYVATCANCGNATWSLHSDSDDERWACDRCHREPMSQEEARALKAARREQADRLAAAKAQEEAAAPKPREVLKAVAAQLIEAKAEHARLEAASDAARDRLGDARLSLDGAEEALSIARNRLAETAVERCFDNTASVRKPSRGVAAETAAVEAARSGLELATSASNTIDDMLGDVGYQVRRLEKRHREAALAVLSDETAPLFVARATEARQEFVMASKGLQWLERAGAAPSSLIAAELRWSWSNLPQSWTAGDQRGPDLDTVLKALLADPAASVCTRPVADLIQE